jgi:hypothetical protein
LKKNLSCLITKEAFSYYRYYFPGPHFLAGLKILKNTTKQLVKHFLLNAQKAHTLKWAKAYNLTHALKML